MNARIEALKKMLSSRPDDARLRFGLALEYEKEGAMEEAVTEPRAYLDATDDEGNAWGRLGSGLRELGKDAEALEAYERGIEAAERHGHPTMADEFRMVLEDW